MGLETQRPGCVTGCMYSNPAEITEIQNFLSVPLSIAMADVVTLFNCNSFHGKIYVGWIIFLLPSYKQ